jgi:excisionase family DNA binding protein
MTMGIPVAKLLTVSEAAQQLGIRPATVRSWIWKRQIEYIKVSRSVRISSAEIQRLIQRGTVPADAKNVGGTPRERDSVK